MGALAATLILGLGAGASGEVDPTVPVAADATTDSPTDPTPSVPAPDQVDSEEPAPAKAGPTVSGSPYGGDYPVTLESNFSRPYKSISSAANSDFSLLDDLERLIRGTYRDPRTGATRSSASRADNYVLMSISRMENSHRVGRELVRAAKAGVKVRVIHGKASQSKESRALASALKRATYKGKHYGAYHICSKGKSLACLSSQSAAIMHSKILLIGNTFTRDKKNAQGVLWTGSANLGGPSGERTYNNGLTVYNDRKLSLQLRRMWSDMWAERNIGSSYLQYVRDHYTKYGYYGGADGYSTSFAQYGMFYSNLANVTVYATPIFATPNNGKDPVLNLLNRIVPDDQCRIRLQQNRFKYRRISVAHKLVELADGGCKISGVYFEDDLKVNRVAHCQQYIRICRPILDVFKTSNRRIEAAWAKPHDKTILVDAILKPNKLNKDEQLPSGGTWPSAGSRTKLVQAGSAALTGSNLIASDEVTTETTDAAVYDDYLEHFKAILKSREYRSYPY
ncbi:phospholipase D-like domain-containing protein [Aeromicrobium sp. NPDC092404]|uniref:phospholipase D-like domain-containing protein n=1 Tax=Aeromicrobium sp. NPDC092404 TaxID=3154976 RepID=UPI00343C02E0